MRSYVKAANKKKKVSYAEVAEKNTGRYEGYGTQNNNAMMLASDMAKADDEWLNKRNRIESSTVPYAMALDNMMNPGINEKADKAYDRIISNAHYMADSGKMRQSDADSIIQAAKERKYQLRLYDQAQDAAEIAERKQRAANWNNAHSGRTLEDVDKDIAKTRTTMEGLKPYMSYEPYEPKRSKGTVPGEAAPSSGASDVFERRKDNTPSLLKAAQQNKNNNLQIKYDAVKNEQDKFNDWGPKNTYKWSDILSGKAPTRFGNVDMNDRPVITWNAATKKKYRSALDSWKEIDEKGNELSYDPEEGAIDTVYGGSARYGEDLDGTGWEIAYTPILKDGTFLSKKQLDDYINNMLRQTYAENKDFTEEDLLAHDPWQVIAGVDKSLNYENDGNKAETIGRAMHFVGKYGAVQLAKNADENDFFKRQSADGLYETQAAKMSELQSERKKLQDYQDKVDYYNSFMNEKDFDKYANKELSSSSYASMWDLIKQNIPSAWGNPSALTSWNDESTPINQNEQNMTKDEKKIFNYLYHTQGKEKAEEYLDFIQENINYRRGNEIAQAIGDNIILSDAYNLISGWNRGTAGTAYYLLNDIFGDKPLPTLPETYAKTEMANINKDKGLKLAGRSLAEHSFDLSYNIGNMAPTVIMSAALGPEFAAAGMSEAAAGKLAGGIASTVMGVGAGAENMNEVWREGASKSNASKYGFVTGLSEAGMETVLGGLYKGTGLTKVLQKVIKNQIGNVALRAGLNLVVSSASEGTEEMTQDVLDPWFRNITLGENNKIDFMTEDQLYSFLQGAATSLVLGGFSDVKNARTEATLTKIGKANSGNVENVISEAERLGLEDSVKRYNDSQKDNQDLGELAYDVIEAERKEAISNIGADNADRMGSVMEAAEFLDMTKELNEYKDSKKTDNDAGVLVNKVIARIGNQIAYADTIDEARENFKKLTDGASDYVREIAGQALAQRVKAETELKAENDIKEAKARADKANGVDKMSENAKNVKKAMSEGTLAESGDFDTGFNYFYGYGRAGMDVDTAIESDPYNVLTDSEARLAWQQGANDRNSFFNEAVPGRKAEGKFTSIKNDMITDEMREKGIREVDLKNKNEWLDRDVTDTLIVLSSIHGINTVVYATDPVTEDGKKVAPNGWYDPNTNTIYIDVTAKNAGKNAAMLIYSHEFTHSLKENAPAEYKALADYIVKSFSGDKAVNITDLANEQIELARDNGIDLTYEQAVDEVIAEASQELFKNSKAIEDLYEKEPKVFDRIKHFIKEIISQIQSVLKKVEPTSAEAKLLKAYLGDMKEAQKLYDDAVKASIKRDASTKDNSSENVKDVVYNNETKTFENKANNKNSSVAFKFKTDTYYDRIQPCTREDAYNLKMIDERNLSRYRKEVDGVFVENRYIGERDLIYLGMPSDVLKNNGIYDTMIRMAQSTARKIVYPNYYLKSVKGIKNFAEPNIDNDDIYGKHGLGMSVLKNLPRQIYDPMAITMNTDRHGSLIDEDSRVIWTWWKTEKNRSIMAVIRVTKDGEIVVDNDTPTVFDPDDEYANQFFAPDKVLYTKNNKDIEELLAGRRPMPTAVVDDIFAKKNIHQKSENVKSEVLSDQSEVLSDQNTQKSFRQPPATDTKGRKLSKGQSEYFKDSTVRDENGNLLVMYHGTPSGGFTVFKNDLNYFTPSKKYAERYTKGRTGTDVIEQLYEVYLNITKPFDISNKTDRNIFINEYVKGGYAQGIDPYSSKADIEKYIADGIDWNEADNLKEFFDDNGYDYDGIILNEGADGGYGDEVTQRGISYVTFSPEQVKRVDNINPTGDKDIRFSLRNTDYIKHVDKDLVKFADDALDGKYSKNEKYVISETIPQRLANDIKRILGISIDASNCTNDIYRDSVTHIDENHGENGKHDKSMSDHENIGLIEYVVNNYEDIEQGKGSKAFKNSNNTKSKTVVLSKRIGNDGFYYVVEAAPDLKNRNQIHVVSAYIGNKNKVSQVSNAKSLPRTSETELTSTSKESLSENYNNVNYDKEDANFSLRDNPRTILADALDTAAVNDKEKSLLKEYKQGVRQIETMEMLAREMDKAAAEAETAAERDQYLTKAKLYREAVNAADKKLLGLEATKPIKDLLKRETEARQNEKAEDIIKRYATRDERKRMTAIRNRSKSEIEALTRSLIKPTKKDYVPEVLKNSVGDFIQSIDFVSKYADPESWNTNRWRNKMEDLARVLRNKGTDGNGVGENGVAIGVDPSMFAPDLLAQIDAFIEKNKGKNISDLNMADLEDLFLITRKIRMGIKNYNRMFTNKRYETAEKAAYETIEELKKKKTASNNKFIRGLDKKFGQDMLQPNVYFKRLGKAAHSIYEGLRDGDARKFTVTRDAAQFFEKTKKDLGIGDKELKRWGNEKYAHTFEVNGKAFDLTTRQIMSLYLLNKRPDAKRHLFNKDGGIVVKGSNVTEAFKDENGKTKTKKLGESKIMLFPDQVEDIIKTLDDTPHAKEFADAIQKYFATELARYGNDVTMKMYGYQVFTDKNYFPMKVYDASLNSKSSDEGNVTNLYSILNMGMTKSINESAQNPLMIDDIVNVFSSHVNDMSKYYGYAMPIADAMKWFNYKYTSGADFNSVKSEMRRAFGEGFDRYITTLISDINGENVTNNTNWFSKAEGWYKAAAVGGNSRVVIQQPLSIIRARNLIDAKYLTKGIFSKNNYEELRQYSPLAWWKSSGFREDNLGQSLKATLTGEQSVRESITEKTMLPAGKADDITWGSIWNAVKYEVKDRLGDRYDDTSYEDFMKMCSDRFSEVIDETQVVDTTLFRSQIMRSKNSITKLATAFMMEPIKSYNILYDAFASRDAKKIRRAAATFIQSAATMTAILSAYDAFRGLIGSDDDKEKDYWERFTEKLKKNALDEFNPVSLIPYLKDIPDLIDQLVNKEFSTRGAQRFDIQWLYDAKDAVSSLMKYTEDPNENNGKRFMRSLTRFASNVSGIPAYNVGRDIDMLIDTAKYDILGTQTLHEKIREAAQYRYDGEFDKYKEAKQKILEDENISNNELIKKIDSEWLKIKKEASGESEDNADEFEQDKVMYKIRDAKKAIEDGNYQYVQEMLNEIYDAGLPEDKSKQADYTEKKIKSFKKTLGKYLYKELDEDSENADDKKVLSDDYEELKKEYQKLKIDGKQLFDDDYFEKIENSQRKGTLDEALESGKQTDIQDAINAIYNAEKPKNRKEEVEYAKSKKSSIKTTLTKHYKAQDKMTRAKLKKIYMKLTISGSKIKLYNSKDFERIDKSIVQEDKKKKKAG